MPILIFLILIGTLLIVFWQISNLISVLAGSPYVMADKKVIRSVLKIAGLKKGETLYDLGSGNGDVLLEASRLGVKTVGYEISPHFYFWAKVRTFGKCITIYNRNIFRADLSKADVVYCYLMPELLKRLAPKFKKELKKSARLVSVGFEVPGLRLLKKIALEKHKIYLYSK